MGLFFLKKRRGFVQSPSYKVNKSTYRDRNTGSTSDTYSLHFECKLEGERFKFVTSDFNKIEESDEIAVVGLHGWNKFHIYAVTNLSNNNELSIATSGWWQVAAGLTLAFIMLLLSRVLDLDFDKTEPVLYFFALLAVSCLLTTIFLRKPYLVNRSFLMLIHEYDVTKPNSLIYPWWRMPIFIVFVFIVGAYFGS